MQGSDALGKYPLGAEGDDTSPTSSTSAYLQGQSTASSSAPVYICGGINENDSISAYTKAQADAVSNVAAFIPGQQFQTDDSTSAYLAGQDSDSDNSPAYTKGKADANNSVSAYVVSGGVTSDNISAHAWGGVEVDDSLSVYLLGGWSVKSRYEAYTAGSVNTNEDVPCYTYGVLQANSSQACYVRGTGDRTSSIHAFIGSPVVRSSIGGYVTVSDEESGEDMANEYITLTNSDASLSKRFHVLARGYNDGALEKMEKGERTLGGGIDRSVGAVYKTWNPTIRVWHTVSDSNYGTLAELETFFKYTDPGGTPSNVITFTDHHGTSYSVHMVGNFGKSILGSAVEGTEASVVVQLRLEKITGE